MLHECGDTYWFHLKVEREVSSVVCMFEDEQRNRSGWVEIYDTVLCTCH